MIQLNSAESAWHFYVVRTQRASAKKARDTILKKYKNAAIVLEINYQPNAVNLFNLIKEELKNKHKVIKVTANYIKICDGKYSAAQSIDDVKKINNDRRDI